jgi:hypothetical protein
MAVRRFAALLLTVVSLSSFLAAATARADCALWDNLVKARQAADDTAKALHKINIPAELEKKIERLAIQKVLENPGMNLKTELEQVRGELTAAEQAQVAPYLTARVLRENADAALKTAEDAYTAEANKKDAALKAAQQAFEQEQQWLQTQKEAIRNIPRDDAYLDRVSRITQRLKAAYLKMKQDLDRFKDCFPDVQTFLDDKDERLKKIDLLDAEIARRRRGKGQDSTDQQTTTSDQQTTTTDQQTTKADPQAPGPLGDTWVCDGPVVTSGGGGKFTSVDANGFAYEKQVGDKKGTGSIKISKSPPLKVRVNERVEIVMVAGGGDPAWVDAGWQCNNVIGGQLPSDNQCSNIPNFKGTGDPASATIRFFFGPGENAFIRMYGGEYNSPDGTRMEVVWKYHKP